MPANLDDFVGFGAQNFRSFGDGTLQLIGPMSKIHLVVGRNNVGKSNLLNLATGIMRGYHVGFRNTPESYLPSDMDWPVDLSPTSPRAFSIALRLTRNVLDHLFYGAAARMEPLLRTEAFQRGSEDVVWFDFVAPGRDAALSPSQDQLNLGLTQSGSRFNPETLKEVCLELTQTGYSNPAASFAAIVDSWQIHSFIPNMRLVDTFRKISHEGDQNSALETGAGLIPLLAKLQNPNFNTRKIADKQWADLAGFVKVVLDDESATIRIPDEKNTILVSTSTHEAMPLASLGTGIGEIIQVAAMASCVNEELICIEEPELHLHPTIQRSLLKYLFHGTTNRYLITTHSASLLNSELASVTHVVRNGRWSQTQLLISRNDLSRAAADLGARASDIIQSNFVVWVEGPSDRLYIAFWLSIIAPELLEGAHFSIIFYGGALLNHLSANDEEASEFIQLLHINRNLALVMDSDRTSDADLLNPTKVRVISELHALGAQCWVTAGYTIENYLSPEALQRTVARKYSGEFYEITDSRFVSPLGACFKGKRTRPSKITVARDVIKSDEAQDVDREDLRNQIEQLAASIRHANGLI